MKELETIDQLRDKLYNIVTPEITQSRIAKLNEQKPLNKAPIEQLNLLLIVIKTKEQFLSEYNILLDKLTVTDKQTIFLRMLMSSQSGCVAWKDHCL